MMKENRFLRSILTTLLILACNTVKAEIVTSPRSTAIQVGSSVFFNCSSSLTDEIHWFHYAVGASERSFVYGYGKFYAPYEGMFELEKNETSYNLIIPSAKSEDAGKYECQDTKGSGDKKSAQLTVLDQGPVCKSDKEIDKVIGPNSCGIEADDLVLTCVIQYRGNEVPMLEWRDLATNNIISNGVTVGSSDSIVMLNLTMKGDPSIDDTSYLCQTRSSTSTPYSCNIGPVRVTGKSDSACSSYRIVTIFLLILIGILIAGIVLWRVFIWRRKDRNKTRETDMTSNTTEMVPLQNRKETAPTDELNAKTTVDKSSKLKNVEAEKPQKDDKRLAPDRQQMQQEIDRLQLKLTEMEQRLYSPENVKYLEKPKFLQTVRNESESEDKKAICGIAILDTILFVVFENSEAIDVYDSVTFIHQTNLVVSEMTFPLDIASSKANNCFYVYIINKVDEESKSSILKINLKGELQHQWETDGGPGRLSTSESTLIVCLYEKNKICEYSGDGNLLQTISLSPASGFNHPLHAIKVTGMHFIVSHGDVGDKVHRVCVVDLHGNVIKESSTWTKKDFIGKSTEKMNVPICLAENTDRFVIVADRDNKQILLLNSVLKFERQLIASEEIGLQYYPVRLAFGENGHLFIAANCRSKNEWQSGRISVFAIKN